MRRLCLALACCLLLWVPGLVFADEGMTIGSALDPLAQPSDYDTGFDLMKAGPIPAGHRGLRESGCGGPRPTPWRIPTWPTRSAAWGNTNAPSSSMRRRLNCKPDLAEAHEYMG